MNKSTVVIIGLLSASVVLLAVYANMIEHRDIGRVVFNTCEKARIDNTIAESTCAKMQIQYKYEYLCQNNNASKETQCWVESNDNLAE